MTSFEGANRHAPQSPFAASLNGRVPGIKDAAWTGWEGANGAKAARTAVIVTFVAPRDGRGDVVEAEVVAGVRNGASRRSQIERDPPLSG